MNRLLAGALALCLVSFPALADTLVPLAMSTKYTQPDLVDDVDVSLNQDGSWTIKGDLSKVLPVDAGYKCLLERLSEANPPSNPTPDNSGPVTDAQMEAVICADPIVRACWSELRPHFTCEAQSSLGGAK